ncbi:hypothetical protein RFI_00009 [Reticulomyxa filosa]|uniref:Uncharacterized protein n=1 Tax=Reticulomyxa filosa TaxID=46433 RepID=X6PH74_RETFI|nr:hypothetical protein RFI_00009 [Reticulomyxa filosa]|eukprot:ETO37052.1 hypothetical protein RFI_00009 [Reticulomyxa filosa]
MSVCNLRDWQSSQSCALITGHKDGVLRFWSLYIPNGSKDVLEQKQIHHSTPKTEHSEDNVTIGVTDSDASHYFVPKLPSYQKRRITPDLNLFQYNSKYNDTYKTTSLKQLEGDTTLRLKCMCTKTNKEHRQVTQIYASTLTHQFLWTSDTAGKIWQWEIRKEGPNLLFIFIFLYSLQKCGEKKDEKKFFFLDDFISQIVQNAINYLLSLREDIIAENVDKSFAIAAPLIKLYYQRWDLTNL